MLTDYQFKNLLTECDKHSFDVVCFNENGIMFDTWQPNQTEAEFEKRLMKIRKYIAKNIPNKNLEVKGMYKDKNEFIYMLVKYN